MKQLKELSKDQLVKRIESSNQVATRARDKTTQIVQGATHVAVSAGMAALTGFLDNRFEKVPGQGVDVGPVPLPAIIGLGLTGLGLTGMGGDASKYFVSAGTGALNAWLAMEGARIGQKSRTSPSPV